jgi:hypothetical protein
MLTHGNVSFTFISNQNNHMVITNNIIHTVSQKMKLYFVHFFFHPRSMSFATMVAYDLSNVINEILIVRCL